MDWYSYSTYYTDLGQYKVRIVIHNSGTINLEDTPDDLN